MTNKFQISQNLYDQIQKHLLKNEKEQVVFAFADAIAIENGALFKVSDIYLIQDDEIQFRSSYHISLTDDCLARVIKRTWDKQAALVDIHSHPWDLYPAQFSPSDLSGFREFVPHIWWRLKHKPILAIVVSPSTFDALVWRKSPEEPEGLSSAHIGQEVKTPTGLTMKALEYCHERRAI